MQASAFDRSRLARRMADACGAAVAVGLFTAPIVWIFARNVSLFVGQHELIRYRYFSSLSILAGEPENVFILQGIPRGILRHLIVWTLAEHLGLSSTAIGTLETSPEPLWRSRTDWAGRSFCISGTANGSPCPTRSSFRSRPSCRGSGATGKPAPASAAVR